MTKRVVLPALMIMVLLGGCGDGQLLERRLEEHRDALADAELSFTAQVCTGGSQEVFSCTLDCVSTQEALSVTVSAPELISGIRATLREGEATLEYEDVQLSAGSSSELGEGPLASMPVLTEAMRNGHILRAWKEHDGDSDWIAAEIYVDEDRQLTIWYRADSLAPAAALFSREGAEYLRCDITDFTWNEPNG